MSNILKNKVLSNPTLEEIKLQFADEQIDWERSIKIKIHDRYFVMDNGVLNIVKKSVEPEYRKSINGEASATYRYFEMESVRGEGAKAATVYSPDVVNFGNYGEFTFDFSGNDSNPNYSLFWWLMNHPMLGIEFDLVRPAKDAQNAFEAERERLKVENMFMTKSPAYIDDEKLVLLASAFKISNAKSIPPMQLRLQVKAKALADIPRFKKLHGSKELEVKALIQEAVDLKVLYYNRSNNTWYYTYAPDASNIMSLVVDTNRPIYVVKPHMAANPNDDFAIFLDEVDGNGHLGVIQECIRNRKDDIVNSPSKKGTGQESIRKFAEQIIVTKP
jgi:hypothetical protein